jgi:hypothetical protein
MTTSAAFSADEWTSVLEGPPSAGMIVITAAHGGMFRETIAMSKAYAEARAAHGQSELLDEIVAAKPKADCVTCAPRSGCCKARQRRKRSISIAGSFSPWRRRWRPRTGRTGRA